MLSGSVVISVHMTCLPVLEQGHSHDLQQQDDRLRYLTVKYRQGPRPVTVSLQKSLEKYLTLSLETLHREID